MRAWAVVLALVFATGACKKKRSEPVSWTGIPAVRACNWDGRKATCIAEGKEYTCVQDDDTSNIVCVQANPPVQACPSPAP